MLIFWCGANFEDRWSRGEGLLLLFGWDWIKEVYVVDGGTIAWTESGGELESGLKAETPEGLSQAKAKVKTLSAQELNDSKPAAVFFVDSSQEFAQGHVPGSDWISRGWLEFQVESFAPSKDAPVAITCADGQMAPLAGATLRDMGYQDVSVLEGGIAAWINAGLPLEKALPGSWFPPTTWLFWAWTGAPLK